LRLIVYWFKLFIANNNPYKNYIINELDKGYISWLTNLSNKTTAILTTQLHFNAINLSFLLILNIHFTESQFSK